MAFVRHPHRSSRRDLTIAIGLAAFVLLAGWWRLVPGVVGVYHDDAIYASTAIGLAEGEGYRLRTLPGAPLQTKYPIGYPALLAPVRLMSADLPTVLAGMQWLTLASAAAFIAAFYLYVRRFGYASPVAGVAIALAVASAPMFLFVATIPLAEAPFALLLIVSFWALEGAGRTTSRGGPWREFLTGMLIALPGLFRTIGLASTIGAVIFLVSTRRLRRPTALGMAVTTVPWLAWAWFGAGAWSADPVSGYYLDYIGPWQQLAPARWPWVLGLNTFGGTNAILGIPAAGIAAVLKDAFEFSLVPASVVFGLFLIPGAIRFRHAPPALPLACYALAVVVWPWPPPRFVLPILGLVLLIWKDGVRASAHAMGYPKVAGALLRAGAIGVVVFNLVLQSEVVTLNRATGYPHAHTTFVAPSWAEYESVFRWIRDETPPDAVVASGLDTMVGLYTGRPALRPYLHRPDVLFYGAPGRAAGTPADLVRFLREHRVRFLVDVPMPGFDEEDAFRDVIARVRVELPELLSVGYRNPDGQFVVYEVNQAVLGETLR